MNFIWSAEYLRYGSGINVYGSDGSVEANGKVINFCFPPIRFSSQTSIDRWLKLSSFSYSNKAHYSFYTVSLKYTTKMFTILFCCHHCCYSYYYYIILIIIINVILDITTIIIVITTLLIIFIIITCYRYYYFSSLLS